MRMKYQHSAPVLDCAFYVGHRFLCYGLGFFLGLSWKSAHTDSDNLSLMLQDPTHSWSGGLDAQLKTHDLNTDQGLWEAVSKVTLHSLLEICMSFIYLCLLFFYVHEMNASYPPTPLLKQIQLLEHMMPLFVAWNIAQRSMSW